MIGLLLAAALAAPRPVPHPGLQAATDALRSVVEEVRGLPFLRPVPVVVEDEAMVRARTRRESARPAGRRALARTSEALPALRLAPPDLDLARLAEDVYGDGLGGWYDADRERLVLVRRAEAFHDDGFAPDSEDALVALHELVHAAQDQHADLRALIGGPWRSGDVALAVRCALEGDATYAMVRLAAGERRAEVDALDAEAFREAFLPPAPEGAPPDALDRLPLVVRVGVTAPYEEGLVFAQQVLRAGGTAGLDAVLRAPPLSTEAVLHPERWLVAPDPPRWPDLPGHAALLGPGWRLTDDDALGELGLRALLATWSDLPVHDAGVVEAAAGWGGDRYLTVNRRDGTRAAVLWTAWDTEADAVEAEAALRAGVARTGGAARVERRGDRVLVGLDLPPDRADAVVEALAQAPEARWSTLDAARGTGDVRARGER